MKKIQHDHIRSISVKQDALDDIYAHFDEFHKKTVFQEECRSWFKDGKQKNRIYLWPGCVSVNPSDFIPAILMHFADNSLPQDDQGAPLRGLRHQISVQQ